jgi:hypothetical protein
MSPVTSALPYEIDDLESGHSKYPTIRHQCRRALPPESNANFLQEILQVTRGQPVLTRRPSHDGFQAG